MKIFPKIITASQRSLDRIELQGWDGIRIMVRENRQCGRQRKVQPEHSDCWVVLAGVATAVETAETIYDVRQAEGFRGSHAIGPYVDNNWLIKG